MNEAASFKERKEEEINSLLDQSTNETKLITGKIECNFLHGMCQIISNNISYYPHNNSKRKEGILPLEIALTWKNIQLIQEHSVEDENNNEELRQEQTVLMFEEKEEDNDGKYFRFKTPNKNIFLITFLNLSVPHGHIRIWTELKAEEISDTLVNEYVVPQKLVKNLNTQEMGSRRHSSTSLDTDFGYSTARYFV